jgi:hypothetical protein
MGSIPAQEKSKSRIETVQIFSSAAEGDYITSAVAGLSARQHYFLFKKCCKAYFFGIAAFLTDCEKMHQG